MAKRSLRASPNGLNKAETALINCSLTQENLADALNVSRQPINKFFNCKPVDKLLFVDICKRLKLNWEESMMNLASML
jgi:DNA-binding XRE family transcriptional regulator